MPKSLGEKAVSLVHKLELVDKALLIQRQDSQIWIPLVRQPSENELVQLTETVPQLELATEDFTQKRPAEETLTQNLEKLLPIELHPKIPHSLDMVGDIAIIEIPTELKAYETVIGQAILKAHKNIVSVHAKAGAISGVYRVRELTHIAGEDRTRTVYHEYGCQYHVDVAKAYFSPRLSQEHHRVAALVKAGEVVADLFAGVGPFAIPIAKMCPEAKVYAVDINPDAVELLKINVRVNRVENRVYPLLGDARELAKEKLCGVADRVIMNLPETAIDFVDAACQTLKPSGGVVHFYGFIRKPDTIDDLKKRFSSLVEQQGRKVLAFQCARGVRETAPYEQQVVLDAQIL
ncbi:MAG: class I SAM-dependent methyltransferase family protein [Candidatus Bathyarchaeia archaeon]